MVLFDPTAATEARCGGLEVTAIRVANIDLWEKPSGGGVTLPTAWGHWTFDDVTGSTIADSSGSGHPLSLQGGSIVTGGVSGNAYRGVGTNVLGAATEVAFPTTDQITFAGWAKDDPTGSTTRYIFGTINDGNFNGSSQFNIWHHRSDFGPSGVVQADYRVGGLAALAGPAPEAVWKHFALTYDGSTVRLYVNGTQYASASASGTIAGQKFAVGFMQEGLVDDVYAFTEALSPEQIALLTA